MTSSKPGSIQIKRVYLPADPQDGVRVLVDRLWPRGVSKGEAHTDHWLKEIAPSAKLRKWFGHDPARFDEFRRRYVAELEDNPEIVGKLRDIARGHKVTLLYGAHDETHNQARVLADFLGAHR
jgi:uncharacterized protein YeaO (DUF488 family)